MTKVEAILPVLDTMACLLFCDPKQMMDTNEIGAFGYAIAMIVYILLTILLLSGWQRGDQSRLPALATGISLLWAGVWAAGFLDLTRAHALVTAVEWARGLAWLIATLAIFREITQKSLAKQLRSGYGLLVLVLAGLPVLYYLFRADDPTSMIVWVSGGFVLSVLVVLAAEQLYRNAPVDPLSGINYLCIAIAGVFLFDLIIYGLVIAGLSTQPEYWASRGFVNALLAAPLALGIWRRSRITPAVQVPRQIAFYAFGMTIIAVYVALVIIGIYYIQAYSGSWSAVAGVVLVVAAIVAAALVAASARIRARVRVFMMKTFLQYKYDYRKEWLRFISTLSKSGLEDVGTTAVRAVAQIVNSPGGVVWIQEEESQNYLPAGAWRRVVPDVVPIDEESALVTFLKDRQWVVDLEEMRRFPERYEDLQLDSWLRTGGWWLVVPLFLGNRLYGFIVLQEPRVVPSLNFEDHDLLRTVGSHVGMHINQAESDRRLSEASQFGAYDRLTAFLMHDLNNLLAQQSLVVENAERFRHNPDFVDDAINTISHSVDRMRRLMGQLSNASRSPVKKRVNLCSAIEDAVRRSSGNLPTPELASCDRDIHVQADSERLSMVIEHLLRNAQEATSADGTIEVNADCAKGVAHISIKDSGCGMTPDFIRNRLFRPFDSTKGSQGMGIGVYQAREYARALGGRLEVTSEPKIGSEFRMQLPLA